MLVVVWLLAIVLLELEYSFQHRVGSSGCGFGRQQPKCILVVVGFLLFGQKIPFLPIFFHQPEGTDFRNNCTFLVHR